MWLMFVLWLTKKESVILTLFVIVRIAVLILQQYLMNKTIPILVLSEKIWFWVSLILVIVEEKIMRNLTNRVDKLTLLGPRHNQVGTTCRA